MRSALALGRKQTAQAHTRGALGKKREGILQGGKNLMRNSFGEAASTRLGQRNIKQADKCRHQQKHALPPRRARQRMKMQRPHA
jgi:hypothetical protein